MSDPAFDSEHAGATQSAVNAAWRTEVKKRIDGIESGEVELLDVHNSHARLRAELAARRNLTARTSPHTPRPRGE